MDFVRVPQATEAQPQIAAGEIIFVDYSDKGGPFRNRVLFDCCAVSFVQQGQKQIYRAAGNTVLLPGHGMLIPEGNSIIAEHSETSRLYNSFIVFFPARVGREFMAVKPPVPAANVDAPYLHFETGKYVHQYIRQMRDLIHEGQSLSQAMALLKVNELLTALYEIDPGLLSVIFSNDQQTPLKSLVERYLLQPMTLEELAFLANRSLSSFKRDFQQAYGLSPQKYIRQRRLEMACAELRKGRVARELYLDYGYQHLANFNTAFKRAYGKTPADWASCKTS